MANVILKDNEAVAVISLPQTLTNSWVDLGNVIDLRDCNKLVLWFDVDINNSVNARIHFTGLMTSAAADKYDQVVIGTPTSGVSQVDFGYWELASDADQKIIIEIDTKKAIPYGKIQVQAGTVGVTAGIITSCYATRGK